jgi:hypothetical protein
MRTGACLFGTIHVFYASIACSLLFLPDAMRTGACLFGTVHVFYASIACSLLFLPDATGLHLV